MRVDVKKVLFVGLETDKELFFKQAQKLGILEFISPQMPFSKELPHTLQHLLTAEKILKKFPNQLEPVKDHVDIKSLALRIEETYNHLERVLEKKRLLKAEMSRVAPFGCFELEKLKEIQQQTGYSFSFYFSKKLEAYQQLNDPELLYLNTAHNLFYFAKLSKTKEELPGFVEMKLEKPYQELEKEYEHNEKEIQQYQEDLVSFTAYQPLIHQKLLEMMNEQALDEAQGATRPVVERQLFQVEAWLPSSKVASCSLLLQDKGILAYPVALEKEDRVPTFLENQGFSRVGEDLVQVYDTPSTSDKDPSMWVLWSFALFFGIIIGDGGYGLLFLAAALLWHFQSQAAKGLTRRMVKLSLILSVSCVLWGGATTSFFGMKLDVDHPLRKLSVVHYLVKEKVSYHFTQKDETYQKWSQDYPILKQLKDPQSLLRAAKTHEGKNTTYPMYDSFQDQLLMEMAIFIGVVHLCFSFGRMLFIQWSSIGWMLALIGGYFYFPASDFLGATSWLHFMLPLSIESFVSMGQTLMIGGIAGALFLSVIQNGASGLFDIANLIQIFSDVLSYLRLYALGLAGGMVSQAFNQMGMDLIDSGVLGMMFGPLVIVVGHMINIVLSLMGGVIHGLRLNFLEWYHYCFEGGGKMLRPLKLMKN